MGSIPSSNSQSVLAFDTSAAAERMQIERWREMSPADKLRLVSELTMSARQLALAGIRQRHPGASEREAELRLAILILGRDVANRVYPEAANIIDR